ncbi:MAG: response regulator, partial [Vulcanimicrobiaceae bacterium]
RVVVTKHALVTLVIGIVVTFGLSISIGGRLARRLRTLVESAAALAEGGPAPEALAGNDEIAEVDRRLRTIVARLGDREEAVNRYRMLAEDTSDSVMFIEGDLITEANSAAAAAYGYSRDEMQGLSMFALRAPELHADLRARLARREVGEARYETIHQRRDGSRFPVEISVSRTRIGDQSTILALIRDISERKANDVALRSALDTATQTSHLKSQFMASMSHEIRTPLNAILGMSELLLGTRLDGEQRDYAESVQQAGEALLHTIDDVLDFSRMEAGQVWLETVEFDLGACIESAAGSWAIAAQSKGLLLSTFVDPDLPPTLLGDPARMRQILASLIGNAVKFTERGRISLSATLEHRSGHIADVRIAIADTGIGISTELRNRIFRPFLQGDGSATRRYGGTGIGLAIVHSVVELMGGVIDVESTEGSGSQFTLRLQLAVADVGAQARLSQLERKRALVADQDPVAREITTRYLRAWGVSTTEAGSPTVASGILADQAQKGEPYDITFLDFSLARYDETELVRLLSDASRGSAHVVLTSAFDAPTRGERAVAAGFNGYIVKPMKQSHLFDCISHLLIEPDGAISERAAPANLPSNIAAPSPEHSERPHVLIVEDNPVNQKLATRQLEKLGCTIELAGNGRVALEAVAHATFDMILMDCQMPEMDGFTATREIRKLEVRTGKRVPIVAMTADARAEDRIACLAADMDDYLAKPVSLPALQQALARWLEGIGPTGS